MDLFKSDKELRHYLTVKKKRLYHLRWRGDKEKENNA